jgi:putative hydrolase of the HAD superfamily
MQRLVLENRRLSLWRRVNGAARDVVAELRRRGYRTGIISNADGKLAELLRLTGWLDAFEAIFDSALLGAEKPAVEIFDRAARAMNLHPSDALYVGDLPAIDIVGAANAGMRPVLYDSHQVFAHEAESLAQTLNTPVTRITRMEELLSLLD